MMFNFLFVHLQYAGPVRDWTILHHHSSLKRLAKPVVPEVKLCKLSDR
jgi:hypothetical protein